MKKKLVLALTLIFVFSVFAFAEGNMGATRTCPPNTVCCPPDVTCLASEPTAANAETEKSFLDFLISWFKF
jgi:hypothetical protein